MLGLRLVVEARHASVGQPVIRGPETGGRISETKKTNRYIRSSTSCSHGSAVATSGTEHLPAVSGAVQAAVVAAHLGAGAADRASPAGTGAGRFIQHGQVGG